MQYLNHEFEQAWQGLDPFQQVDKLTGDIYRAVAARRTLRFEQNGSYYFAKIHHGVGWAEIFKNLLTLKKPVLGAMDEWSAINMLNSLGIETMTVVAYGVKGRNPAQIQSFIVTRALDNTVSLEDFCRSWQTQPAPMKLKLALLRKVAVVSRTLHENGVNHRDYYICHFLLNIESVAEVLDGGDPVLSLIDLHRAQLRHTLPVRWRVKDISGLLFSAMDIGLTSRDLARFMQIYSGKTLRQTLADDNKFWRQVLKRANKMYLEANSQLPTCVTRWL
jgi:heptose I phosphotransferase